MSPDAVPLTEVAAESGTQPSRGADRRDRGGGSGRGRDHGEVELFPGQQTGREAGGGCGVGTPTGTLVHLDSQIAAGARESACTGLKGNHKYRVQLNGFGITALVVTSTLGAEGVRSPAHYNLLQRRPEDRAGADRVEVRPTIRTGTAAADTYAEGDTILVDVELRPAGEGHRRHCHVHGRQRLGGPVSRRGRGRQPTSTTAGKNAILHSVLHGGRTLRFAYTVLDEDGADTDGIWVQTLSDAVVQLFQGGTEASLTSADDRGSTRTGP